MRMTLYNSITVILYNSNGIIDTDLGAAFGDEPTDFRSAAHINDFLAKRTTLLIQNRISSRHASVSPTSPASNSAPLPPSNMN